MNAIDNLIQQRRTVKPEKFAEDPVEDHFIEQMLENANWAPTHGFTEPWRFWVFKGEGLTKLADFHANLYKAETPADDFKSKTYQKLYDRPLKASHVIAIGMKRGDNPKIPEIEEVEATACAVQNMMLTASYHGIGTYWNSGGMTYHDKMKAFFDLGEADKLLGFLFVGYPSNEWPKGKRISEATAKTQWITVNS
jgi:nitroreductase